MPVDYHNELATMRDAAVEDRALIIRLATANAERIEHIEELMHRAGTGPEMPPTCRHEVPVFDYCAYCNETPEG